MTLIKSISGIRGTIGGRAGEGLTPIDIVKFTAAFGKIIVKKSGNNKIVVGRDARISGEMVSNLVIGTLQSIGIDVIDLGLSTTPTVEIAVPKENAGGGIILTASHNPGQWNALKLLNDKGEFINDAEGKEVLSLGESLDFDFAEVGQLGKVEKNDSYLQKHIADVLALDLVDAEAVRNANFKVAVDAVNSTGGLFIPALLEALGVQTVYKIHCEPNGQFPHNPEPLKEHLTDLSKAVTENAADLGIAVDPDVDRLVFMMEDGELFGEEYTLVAVADYILQHTKGNTVSNLSSTRALRDVTVKHGGEYFAAAVGEVNVVTKMKEVNAVIGGEGNGGVIYPASHYGRDALVGVAIFLTHLARLGKKVSAYRAELPQYYMSKNKITLTPELDIDNLLAKMEEKYKHEDHSTIDGLKIDFANEWVHLRKSNTEPIIRIYSEGPTADAAEAIAQKIIREIEEIIK
ncbi:phosphoglucosamine mutase [Sphingobacterium spiritivorum]|uniref:Phosphoglucosamine mutase n=1 Tax=Sphingobacterium spiritivorum ATCC 33861 TaxID=525373 RepID=D7VKF5_SPHSI|nr:phosphoglucosamine mutase [Sphingobacterium spiritivorum]EFK58757.1 phosphoglucosamine mutase [Sphingobacterium spiritivorum ATCC 33861]QQT34358.1 phosphoglucosamine mutase [Sphingobacterium spiritivorum]WQD35203.1 phosphoglucosamine mutase [Sphingobacterium spiritivorum]SUI99587.1 Phosphomannomutase/phosphoglucomutase [Sphingobacterium spiritivorum]